MTEKAVDKNPIDTVYGFEPEAWESLPQWLQTFITESNERNASASHAQHRQSVQYQWEQSWKSADLILRTLITIEGGSLVAIMAFLGVLAERGAAVSVEPLLWSLGAIGAALLFAVMAGFASYFVSAHYGEAFEQRRLTFDHPFVVDTSESLRAWKRGGIIRLVGIFFAAASLISMAGGVVVFGSFISDALEPMDRGITAADLSTIVRTTQNATSAPRTP